MGKLCTIYFLFVATFVPSCVSLITTTGAVSVFFTSSAVTASVFFADWRNNQ
jgi:hypothetical protein